MSCLDQSNLQSLPKTQKAGERTSSAGEKVDVLVRLEGDVQPAVRTIDNDARRPPRLPRDAVRKRTRHPAVHAQNQLRSGLRAVSVQRAYGKRVRGEYVHPQPEDANKNVLAGSPLEARGGDADANLEEVGAHAGDGGGEAEASVVNSAGDAGEPGEAIDR